jgi:hypothetical protein
MSRSAVLEKSTLGLDDLDAFVDESMDAMDEQELKAYQATIRRIASESKRRVSGSAAAVPEKVQSA